MGIYSFEKKRLNLNQDLGSRSGLDKKNKQTSASFTGKIQFNNKI